MGSCVLVVFIVFMNYIKNSIFTYQLVILPISTEVFQLNLLKIKIYQQSRWEGYFRNKEFAMVLF